jgi:hypothetical protein
MASIKCKSPLISAYPPTSSVGCCLAFNKALYNLENVFKLGTLPPYEIYKDLVLEYAKQLQDVITQSELIALPEVIGQFS